MKIIVKKVIFLIIFCLSLFQLYRILFYTSNFKLFPQFSFNEGIGILKGGFLYDYILSLILLLPFLLLTILLLVFKSKKLLRFITTAYISLTISFITLLVLVNIIYYQYNYHHISKSDLLIIYENKGLSSVFLQQYWYLIIIVILIALLSYKIAFKWISNIIQNSTTNKKKIASILTLLFLFLFSALLMGKEKNGVGFLTPASVFNFSDPQLASITMNPTYFLIHSFISRNNPEDILSNTYANEGESLKNYPVEKKLTDKTSYNGYLKGRNVVVFIIESASRELFIDSFPIRPPIPFLDSLKKESLFFTNAFANSLSSPEGVNAILGGIPNLFYKPFNKTVYAYHPDEYIGHKLNKIGYNNYFFYSADKSATGFSKVANLYGIKNYLSTNDFKGLNENETSWGVYDHIFFSKVADKLKNVSSPFFAVLFNISTHNPFNLLPDSLLRIKKEKKLDLSQAYGYYDNVLKNFFSTISSYNWYKNTVFVFVADHYSRSVNQQDRSKIGVFRIPIMIYSPEELFKGEQSQVVQQIDLPITLLNLLGYQGSFNSLGKNIFDSTYNKSPFAVNRIDNRIQIIKDSLALGYNFKTNTVEGLWNYQKDRLLLQDLSQKHLQENTELLQELKYYLESFKNYILRK